MRLPFASPTWITCVRMLPLGLGGGVKVEFWASAVAEKIAAATVDVTERNFMANIY